MNQGYSCSLHHETLEYFCERCLEPICHRCTITGPHHTEIHSIVKLAVAYERKVQQVKNRVDHLAAQNRQSSYRILIQLNDDLKKIQAVKKSVDAENNQEKQRLILNLTKEFENNRSALENYKESLLEKANSINDLGFKHQSIEDQIQFLSSHHSILAKIKEYDHRAQILLDKRLEIHPLPQELSIIRLRLKEIEAYSELEEQKVELLNAIMVKTSRIKPETVNVPYQKLLAELQKNLGRIHHYVCHFCGIPFSEESVNTGCPKNSTGLGLTSAILDFDSSNVKKLSDGFCNVNPDSNRLGTHRHYFGSPKDHLLFYGENAKGTYKLELEALLLKCKTISRIKSVNIKSNLLKNDKSDLKACEKVVFDYIFVELLGMKESETEKLLTLTAPNPKGLFQYEILLKRIEQINI